MYNHAPPGYNCPFCHIVRGGGDALTTQEDIVLQNEFVTVFVTSHWWPNNPGYVVVIPNEHYENIYDLPITIAGHIHAAAQKVALAFKTAYGCDGTSTRQHNEPAGNQEVWHYHLHVFPRYQNDRLYSERKQLVSAEQRRPYAEKLRQALHEIAV